MKKIINLKLELDYDEKNEEGTVKLLDNKTEGIDYTNLDSKEQNIIIKYLLNVLYTSELFKLHDKYGDMTEEEFMQNEDLYGDYENISDDFIYDILCYLTDISHILDDDNDSELNPFIYQKLFYDEDNDEWIVKSITPPLMPSGCYNTIISELMSRYILTKYIEDNEIDWKNVTDRIVDECYNNTKDCVIGVHKILEDIDTSDFSKKTEY